MVPSCKNTAIAAVSFPAASVALLLLLAVCAAATTIVSYDKADPIYVAVPGDFTNVHAANPTYNALSLNDNETYAGLVAAFHEANTDGGVHGRNLSATKILTYGAHSSYAAESATNTAAIFAPFGPGRINFTAVVGGVITVADRLMTLSQTVQKIPVVGAVAVNPTYFEEGQTHALHLKSSTESEALHMLRYATERLHCRRFLVFFLPSFGMPIVAAKLEQVMAKMGLPAPTMQMTVLVRNTTHYHAWKDQLLPTLEGMAEPPHAVFLFLDGETSRHIVELYSKSSSFKQGHMFFFMASFGAVLNYTDSEGKSAIFKNLFTSTSYPFADDTRYKIVKEYHTAFDNAKAAGAMDVATAPVHNPFAFDGYIIGRAVVETLRMMSPADITASGFIDTFFKAKLFGLSDLVFGPYSKQCVGSQTAATGACWCNTGTKMQHIITVDPATGLAVGVRDDASLNEEAVAEIEIPLQSCGVDGSMLVEPFEIVSTFDTTLGNTPASSSSPHFSEAVYAYLLAKAGGVGPVDQATLQRTMATYTQASQFKLVNSINHELVSERQAQLLNNAKLFAVRDFLPDATKTTLATHFQRYNTLAATFPMVDESAITDAQLTFAPLRPSFKFLDRDPDTLPFSQHQKYLIHLFPTLADFAQTTASYASSLKMADRVIVVADTPVLLGLAQRSVETFGSPMLHGSVITAYSFTAGAAAPSSFTSMSIAALARKIEDAVGAGLGRAPVVGAGRPEAVVMVLTHHVLIVNAVLEAAKSAIGARVTFVLCTSELRVASAVNQANITAGMTSAARPSVAVSDIPTGNILFASGIPPGAGLSNDVFGAYGDIVGRALVAAFEVPSDRTAAGTAKAVMQLGSLSHKSITLEPFSATSCELTAPVYPHPGGTCQCTKGLDAMNLYNVSRASAKAGRFAFDFVRAVYHMKHAECGVKYVPLPPSAAVLSTLEIALIGAAGAVVTFGSVFAVIYCVLRPKGRDIRNAPKNAAEPFAVVFTDIQASTAMWALAPDHMGAALDVHHRTMRDLIREHKGYEVKTIGDSFMVAFKEASAAAKFSVATQQALYDAPWNTTVFDMTYDDILMEKYPELDRAIRMNGKETLWQGIRVRVGVHYGQGTVVFDETTQAYDYYGTVVNTAARVEGVGHGGQVILTEAAFNALHDDAWVAGCHVEKLGPQPLRGLPEEISLVQILPMNFAGRQFPPLRLDVEIVVEEDDSSTLSSGEDAALARVRRSTARTGGASNADGTQNNTAANGSEVPSSERSGASHAPKTVQGVAKRLLAKGGNKAPLEVLLLVDRALATLMAPDTQSNRVSVMKRWAEKWRVPKLHRREAKQLSQVAAADVARVRLSLRVVESMAAAGTLGYTAEASEISQTRCTSYWGPGQHRSSRQLSNADTALKAAMSAPGSTPGSPADGRVPMISFVAHSSASSGLDRGAMNGGRGRSQRHPSSQLSRLSDNDQSGSGGRPSNRSATYLVPDSVASPRSRTGADNNNSSGYAGSLTAISELQ